MSRFHFNHCIVVFKLTIIHVLLNSTNAQISAGGTPIGFKFLHEKKIPLIEMPSVDVQALRQQDSLNDQNKNVPYRFAYNHFTHITPHNHGLQVDLEDGRLWALRIKSPGALSLNFGFENLQLAIGAKLFLYNIEKTFILGGFTKDYVNPDYPFATEIIPDDEVVIELFEPAEVAGQSHFKIFRVSHGYRPLPEVGKGFGDAGSCMVNVNCPAGSPYQDIKKSVICLISGGSEFCSAALVNNTNQDGTPYVLTADHCVSGSVTNWVFRFNWEAAGCNNPASSPASSSLTGAQLIASNAGSDFALLKITASNAISTLQSIGAVYAGWDRSTTPAPSAVCIHHPSGDIKKISLTSSANSTATYSGAQCWKTGTWTTGATEPGSSGSPLFNPQKRIVGQLFGGPSFCGASTSDLVDYYGRFDVSWNGSSPTTRLRDWLDPGNTNLMVTDLYDPNSLPIALDASISGIISPISNYCGIQSITPQVIIKNNGTIPLTACTIQYKIDNGPWQNFSWSGNLMQNQTNLVILPVISGLSSGIHTYSVRTQNPNGGIDQIPSNDMMEVNFNIVNNNSFNIPISEGFQGVTFPPSGWTVINPENLAWSSANVGGFGSSTKSAAINNFSTSTDLTGNVDDLVMPFLNTSSLTGSFLQLSFDVAYARYSAQFSDTLKVLVSTDCGNSWTLVYQKFGSTLATASDQTTAFTPTSSQWRKETVSLNSFIGSPDIQIRFRCVSGWGNWLYIDNVNISNVPPQPPVPSFSQSSTQVCQGGSITYTNTSQNAVSVSWSFQGGTPSTSQSMGSVTVTYNSSGTFITMLSATSPDGATASTSQQVNVFANPQPVIVQNGATISVTGTFSSYQWFLNGSPIANANSSVLNISGNGSYSVQVTNAQGCTGYSNTIQINNWSVEPGILNQFEVYPNPAREFLQLSLNPENLQNIEIFDNTGRQLKVIRSSFAQIIPIHDLSPGYYQIRIQLNNGSSMVKSFLKL